MRRFDRSTHLGCALPLLFLAPCLVTGAAADDEKPPAVVKADDARNHIAERCTVELTVRSSKNAAGHREYYLDSEEDFHAEKNFAVVISYDHADLFKKAGIDDPAEHYKGKSLQVTGKVIHENDQVRIRVEDPKQIKIVETAK
jgi:DNA/RNA endonuclease YhcR with UshA esterase domain